MIRTLRDGGINWTWYLCGDFNEVEKTVHIFYHDRWHDYEYRGSNHPKHEKITFRIIERDNRIADKVKVLGKDGNLEYTVTNPAQVFSYRDMSHYVAE